MSCVSFVFFLFLRLARERLGAPHFVQPPFFRRPVRFFSPPPPPLQTQLSEALSVLGPLERDSPSLNKKCNKQ
jgi:hypothetical protein